MCAQRRSPTRILSVGDFLRCTEGEEFESAHSRGVVEVESGLALSGGGPVEENSFTFGRLHFRGDHVLPLNAEVL